MTPLLLAALLSASDVDAKPDQPSTPARLLESRAEVQVGVLGSGYTVAGTRWGDALFTPALAGRYLLGGFLVDGTLQLDAPLAPGGVSTSAHTTLRVGWAGQRWAVHAGAFGLWAQEGRPRWQWLPTLRGEVAFESFGLSAGVFDHGGLVPLHLTLELPTKLGHASVGYVAPLGLLVGFSRPLTGALSLRAQAFVYRLMNTDQAAFTLGLAWGGAR